MQDEYFEIEGAPDGCVFRKFDESTIEHSVYVDGTLCPVTKEHFDSIAGYRPSVVTTEIRL